MPNFRKQKNYFNEWQLKVLEQLLKGLNPSENLKKYWNGYSANYSDVKKEIDSMLKRIETYPKTSQRFKVGDYVLVEEEDFGKLNLHVGIVSKTGNFARYYVAILGRLDHPNEAWDSKYWKDKQYLILKKLSKRKALKYAKYL